MGPKKDRRVRKIKVLSLRRYTVEEGGEGGKKEGGRSTETERKLHTQQRREWPKNVQRQTEVTYK